MSYQISLESDDLMKFCGVTSFLEGCTSRRFGAATVYRWSARGVAGVRLPFIMIGGTRYTSRQALEWFFRETAAAKSRKHGDITRAGIRRAKAERQRDTESEATELGI